jgi:hypothetical protein
MMKLSLAQITVGILLVLSISAVNARSWRDVIDADVYRRSNKDIARTYLKIEVDPMYFAEDHPVAPPVAVTAAPTVRSNRITTAPSDSPSASPSLPPSDAPSPLPSHLGPTSAPSRRVQNVEGNGGCPEGSMLFRANMRDSFGNGWDGTVLTVFGIEDQDEQAVPASTVAQTTTATSGDVVITVSKTIQINPSEVFVSDKQEGGTASELVLDPLGLVFHGGLRRGSHGYYDFCLKPRRCYEVSVQGGSFLEEVSWDIQALVLGADVQDTAPLLQGTAPMDCSLSLPDANGAFFCSVACNNTISSDYAEASKVFDNAATDTEDVNPVVNETPVMPHAPTIMNVTATLEGVAAAARSNSSNSHSVQSVDFKTFLNNHKDDGHAG